MPRPPKASLLDPATLLDPRGQQRTRNDDLIPSNQLESSDVEMEQRSGPGLASMIENLNGVEDRSDVPRKRRKVSQEPNESDKKKSAFGAIGSNGVWTDFSKEQREEAKSAAVHNPSADVVDLTLGE